MKYVLATGNKNKISEMRSVLAPYDIEVVTQYELGLNIETEETGDTFLENAMLKARAVCLASGLPAIADDSGLVVDALHGAPGVHSKRYGGRGLDDAGLCAYLLEQMKDTAERTAKFVSQIVCVFPNGVCICACGECYGEILTEPRGDSGFGYDPVFLVKDTGRSMAEISKEEKNAVSHRGNALREFTEKLKNYYNLEGKTKC